MKEKISVSLEDNSCFEGYSFGAKRSVSGEVVFNTGMIGYPESMTDPSYHGQILVLTYPLIGNYGVPGDDKDSAMHDMLRNFESEKIRVKGLVISDYSASHSHWNSVRSLSQWMDEQGIPGVYGIDTRMLTKKLREQGVMLGKIAAGEEDPGFEDPNKRNLVGEVSVKKPVTYTPSSERKARIVLVDCGVKNNIIRSFLSRNVEVLRVPWDHEFATENFDSFDGLFISNGPGDPKMCTAAIR
ncbi:carbamoyl-phosphate synthase (glutamine-hydrolyzing) small subunit, partial [Candidatus Woesearchaeota archaeon]|nr:carbamoyl-phosphate synthase (glutamine-hydrolyzing) small subunit [Candidatus Woesearchaeota archaeon]